MLCAQSIIFLPMFPFSIEAAVIGLVAFDLVGALTPLLRFLRINHFGHLGGALFGYWYISGGGTDLWRERRRFLNI